MKEFFNLNKPYEFDFNDVRALLTLINVTLIIIFGSSVAYFGLAIALLGIAKDLLVDRKISSLLMHTANMILNCYFISLLFKQAFGPGAIVKNLTKNFLKNLLTRKIKFDIIYT